MKFSAQEEYGLRCLLAIGHLPKGQSATIPEISQTEGLSQPHVAKLLAILRKAGFISSTRGQAGGYTLAVPPNQIVIGSVLEVLGGKLYEDGFCERHTGVLPSCAHDTACSLRAFWGAVQQAVDSVVDKMTLQDLLIAKEKQPLIKLQGSPTHKTSARALSSVEASRGCP